MKHTIAKASLAAGLTLAGVALTSQQVKAAENVQPDHEVATVTYQGPGKVRLLNGQGQYQDQYLDPNTTWKTFAKGVINEQAMYRLGTDAQWIPAQYTNLSQELPQNTNKPTNNQNNQQANNQNNQNNQNTNQNTNQTVQPVSQRQKVSGLVQVFGNANGTQLYKQDGTTSTTTVKNNSVWKAFEKGMIDNQLMYRIGSSSQWLPARFTLGLVPYSGYSSAWVYPIATGRGQLTSGFGNQPGRNWHDGIDIIPNHGGNEDIRAIHGGTVYYIGHEGVTQNDLGYYICVKSPDGYNTVYQEFAFYPDEADAAIHVKVGDVVRPGQVILSFIPTTHVTHVHIGVTQSEINAAERYWNSDNGTWLDPWQLIALYQGR
jgi:hypothetical protein